VTAEQPFLPAFAQFPEIKAGFTTRLGGASQPPFASRNLGFFAGDEEAMVASNWRLTLTEMGFEGRSLVLPRMVHGTLATEVTQTLVDSAQIPIDVRAGLTLIAPRECDAVFTREPDFVLAVTMADCMPILVYDPTTHYYAAIHSGWRGTRAQVVAKTLGDLFRRGYANPASTWVCMGPAIGGRRLELGPEVMATMDARFAVSCRL
jgi:polyphenol oxidase